MLALPRVVELGLFLFFIFKAYWAPLQWGYPYETVLYPLSFSIAAFTALERICFFAALHAEADEFRRLTEAYQRKFADYLFLLSVLYHCWSTIESLSLWQDLLMILTGLTDLIQDEVS